VAVSDGRRDAPRFPFEFGEIVYHRARTEKIGGVVTGFIALKSMVKILVVWGDDLNQVEHQFFELTTEFTPDFSTSSES
jgi:hypothetical protein